MRNQLNQIAGLLLATIVVVGTTPSFAAVNTGGDVPQASTGFGTIFVDENGDQISDTIDDQGNNVFDFLANPTNPLGPNSSANGDFEDYRWDDLLIWIDYETDQNLLVGEQSSGSLEINGGSALRYQHLVLGGVAATHIDGNPRDPGNSVDAELQLQTGDATTAVFDFQAELSQGDMVTTGVGEVTITGFGSVYNNAVDILPGELQIALDAAGYTGATLTPDNSSSSVTLDGITYNGSHRPTTFGGGDDEDGYDVYVGLHGTGVLNVTSGGAVQIQDGLLAGLRETASGTITVDGSGSSIIAYGREEFDSTNGESNGSDNFPSIIGGHGNATMSITNGGRVDMFNGASLGHSYSTAAINQDLNDAISATTGTGSGHVIVDGFGSVWNVYASGSALVDIAPGGSEKIALAVGQLRDRSLPYNGDENLGNGILEIGTGARVNVTQTDSYQNTIGEQANKMVVGDNGRVIMRGGILSVGDGLTNDGLIEGYGQITAGDFNNTTLGEIDGGGDTTISTQRFDLQATGQFNNDGVVQGNGDLTAGTFYNGILGRVVVEQGESLKIISTDNNARTPGVVVANQLAYSENDDALPNFRLMTDTDGMGGPGDGIVDAQDANFYQANIGSIDVQGGEIEFGRAQAVDPFADVDREQAFLNARYATPDNSDPYTYNAATMVIEGSGTRIAEGAFGAITSNDGTLTFRNGLYNTGVIAFTGGDNIVNGKVLNDTIDYDPATPTGVDDPGTIQNPDVFNNELLLGGVIVVSGDFTTVTFTDDVVNSGSIVVGPNDAVANFLGDLTVEGGTIEIDGSGTFTDLTQIVIAGDAIVTDGTISIGSVVAPSAGMSATLLKAGELDPESQFTNLDLPELSGNLHWDIVYDTIADEVRLEVVESVVVGADFNGDGVVDANDISVWSSHVGILSGASAIQGDADLDGDVDLDDYLLINQQIVTGVPVAAATSSSLSNATSIPEPSSAILLMLAASGLCGARRRV